MGHIETSRELTADPQALWAWVANPTTWHDWFSVHESWLAEPPSPLTAGAHLSARIVMLGLTNDIVWVVQTVEAPTRLVISGTGSGGVKATFTFTIEKVHKIESHSLVTVAGDFQGALIEGAFNEIVERDGIKQLDKSLDALDALASAAA
ncbi:MAG: SRPBCC family protein [Mycobacterium sp.]|nr:SRPBCC family protein [Mycobacterium sp.]